MSHLAEKLKNLAHTSIHTNAIWYKKKMLLGKQGRDMWGRTSDTHLLSLLRWVIKLSPPWCLYLWTGDTVITYYIGLLWGLSEILHNKLQAVAVSLPQPSLSNSCFAVLVCCSLARHLPPLTALSVPLSHSVCLSLSLFCTQVIYTHIFIQGIHVHFTKTRK